MTNKEIVKAWFAALDAKDFNTLKNLMDSKYKFYNPMSPAPMVPEEHLGMMQGLTSAFDGSHKINVIIGEENNVAVSGYWSAKHIGEFNGIPASGKTVNLSFVNMMNIVDGKVVIQHMEFNPMTMMSQIGAAPVNA